MIKRIIIFTFFLWSYLSFSSELEAEFVINDNIKEIREGDTFSATLRVWPIENVNKDEFIKLVGTNLFGSFYVVDFESLDSSPNNADVFEAKGTFIGIKKIEPDKLFFTLNGNSIRVRFKEIYFRPLENNNKDFELADQADDYSLAKYLIFLIGPVLLITAILKRDWFLTKIKKKTKIDPRLNYRKIFHEAKTRENFEEIYALKEQWMPLLESFTPSHQEFFNVLNNHQFKKEWTELEKKEVEECFETIRRSF